MKRTITFLSLALLISGSLAAQTKKESKKKAKAKEEASAKEVQYRLVLSFISKGGGIDYKAHEKIKDFIEKYPKKPAFAVHHWGREGEVDYCLHLKELSAKEQVTFVEEIKKLIDNQDMVLVQENQAYVKKGK
ncbi:MAG TPA: hypothetical protein VNY73_10285 [Bacteroidia bacterium]|jgi:hypothetical protein|nr:hypothetical protein [Bacteroidia bacterium]